MAYSATRAGALADAGYWRRAAEARTTPPAPDGWHTAEASICGVDFTAHFKIGLDGECEDWRVYPAGTNVDIGHAVDDKSQIWLALDRAVAAEIDRIAADEAHHVATAGVPSLRETEVQP